MKREKGFLETYRLANRFVAAHRDKSQCPMCEGSASESDHVFGRGSSHDKLKEHWALRMSLCRDCHHKKHHGSGFDMVRQVQILVAMNEEFIGGIDYTNILRAVRPSILIDLLERQRDALDFIVDWLAKNG